MSISNCPDPACSITSSRVLLKGEAAYMREGRSCRLSYDYRLCERCSLGFVHPMPAEEVIACFYTGDYTYYQPAGQQPWTEAGSWKYRIARRRYLGLLRPGAANGLASLFAALAEFLARKSVTFTLGVPLALPRDARILDYGYGTGSWLLAMRLSGYSRLLGWDIAANTERREELTAHGIEVVPPDGLDRLDAASLDCVRLEHVFEHLVEPLAALRSLYRLLKPGGLLVMTFPSIYPWLRVKDLAASPFLAHMQLPIHLRHHSIESSGKLLSAAGFETIACRITVRERFITLMARKPTEAGS
jgi:SAM-dependent methyltransferase